MFERILDLRKRPILLFALLIAILLFASAFSWGVYQTQFPPNQPIEFPHDVHVGLGIQCLYCHPGALRGASAGLPTRSKCWGCHQQIAKKTPELEALFRYVETDEPIQWVPVAIVPDFVQFNHRPHIAGGLNCETCHGEMRQFKTAQNPQTMNMGWCLDCHRDQAQDDEGKLVKLLDCATCHY